MSTTSFDKVLNEVIENYQAHAEQIHQAAQSGKATPRSEMNAFQAANAQATLVSNLRFHIRKGLVTTGSEMEGLLKRTKSAAIKDRHEGFIAVIALCDRLLTKVNPEMVWDISHSVN